MTRLRRILDRVTGIEWARKRRDLRQARILRQEMLQSAQRWVTDYEARMHITPEMSVRMSLQTPYAYHLSQIERLERKVQQLQHGQE